MLDKDLRAQGSVHHAYSAAHHDNRFAVQCSRFEGHAGSVETFDFTFFVHALAQVLNLYLHCADDTNGVNARIGHRGDLS